MTEQHFLIHGIISSQDIDCVAEYVSPVEGGRLQIIDHQGVAAITSVLPADRLAVLFEDAEETQAVALAQHDFLQELSQRIDILPIRLGAVYAREAAIIDMLDRECTAFLVRLEAISGQAEFVISVAPPKPPQPESAPKLVSGRDYLAARRQRLQSKRDRQSMGEGFLAELEDLLSAQVDGVVSDQRPADASWIGRYTVLTSKAFPEVLAAQLEEFRTRLQDVGGDLQVTGPWPTYRFGQEIAA